MRYNRTLCDRCGKLLKVKINDWDEEQINFFRLVHDNAIEKEEDSDSDEEKYYELCVDCYQELVKWMSYYDIKHSQRKKGEKQKLLT